jgi:hypothetical protein
LRQGKQKDIYTCFSSRGDIEVPCEALEPKWIHSNKQL